MNTHEEEVKIEKIKKLYQEYIIKVKDLRLEQESLLINFIKEREKEHLERIKQNLKNKY